MWSRENVRCITDYFEFPTVLFFLQLSIAMSLTINFFINVSHFSQVLNCLLSTCETLGEILFFSKLTLSCSNQRKFEFLVRLLSMNVWLECGNLLLKLKLCGALWSLVSGQKNNFRFKFKNNSRLINPVLQTWNRVLGTLVSMWRPLIWSIPIIP